MATADDDDGGLTFYPAFCYKASPTHFAWVKMTAADVHRLKTRPELEGRYLLTQQLILHRCSYVCSFSLFHFFPLVFNPSLSVSLFLILSPFYWLL